MSSEDQASQDQAVQQLYAFIAEEMQSGSDKATIAKKLEEQGIDANQAAQFVNTAYEQIATTVKEEAFSAGAMLP
ncbi:MAG: hypothetical protein MJA83_03970, partial [Gammaproteobacteria bacterium]|nr:hypothetical protein [Gammaproteobacteria bacterium]